MKKIILATMLCGAVCCMGCGELPRVESESSVIHTTAKATTAVTEVTQATTTAAITTTATTNIADITSEPNELTHNEEYPVGTWFDVTNTESVYVFRNNGSGAIYDLKTGEAVPFRTEFDTATGAITFHLGNAEQTEKATVFLMDEPAIVLQWEAKESLILEFISPDEKKFYNFDQLGQLALEYYAATKGAHPNGYSVETGSNGILSIKIFENMEDHTATLDWYFVDPFNCVGEDLLGNYVCLLEPATQPE